MTELTKEEVVRRAKERRAQKAQREALKDTKFPVDITPVSGMDVFNDFTSGIQSMANPALRLAARAEQGLTGTDYFGGILANQQASVDRGRSLRAPETGIWKTGDFNPGDMAGEVAGAIALTKGQGVAPTMAGRLAQAGTTGAALGPAMAPMEEDTLSAMNTGAKYGLLMTPAFEGIRYGAQNFGPPLRKVFSGTKTRAAQMLKDLLGEQKPAVKNALRNTKSRVPGERLTTGEAAAPARSPEMSVLQKMVDEEMPQKYDTINQSNKAARLAAIKSQGGNIKELKVQRDVVTTPMREQALSLANQSGRLRVNNLVSSIDDVLSDKMIPTIQRKALQQVKDNILSRADPETGMIDANALYTVRKEIGNTLEATFSKEGVRWDKAMSGRIQGKIQNIIDDVVEGSGGAGWKDYLRTYKEKSIPIENANLGNQYAGKLSNPLGQETPSAFAGNAMRKPPKSQGLAVETDAVMESLQRRKDLAEMARLGVTNTRDAMNVPGLPNTGMFSPAYQVTKSILNRFSDRATKGVMRELANAFDDPAKVLALLEKTDIPGPVQRTIYELSKQQAAATAGALGGKYSFEGVHPH